MKSRVIVALVLLATTVYGGTDSSFRMSSLVVPQGVSCNFSSVRFTRDKNIVNGTFQTRNVKRDDNVFTNESYSASQSESAQKVSDALIIEKGGSINANLSPGDLARNFAEGGLGNVISKAVDVKGNYGRQYKTDDISTKETSDSTGNCELNHRVRQESNLSDDKAQGTFGDHYIAFTMTLKNLDLNDTYTIKPSVDGGLKAVVEGLSEQIEVPCVSSKSFSLDIGEERLCRFLLKVVDERLLDELKAIEAKQALSKLKPKINGSIFPIISDETGKNILKERKRAQILNPTTEISLSFGKASMMSPWSVKRFYGKDSGRNGQKVTLCDALMAINEYVAAGDTMPDKIFDFDVKRHWTSVYGDSFGKWRKGGPIPGVRIDEKVYLSDIPDDVLNTPLADMKEAEVFNAIDVMWGLGNKPNGGGLRAGLVRLFDDYSEKSRSEIIDFARYMLLSPDESDCKQGIKMLRELFVEKQDCDVASWLLYYYPFHSETFEYRDDVDDWIDHLFSQGCDVPNIWVKHSGFVFGKLKKDSMADAIISLAKSPGFSVSTNGTTLLMRIAQSGDVKLAEEFLDAVGKKDVGINRIDGKHRTALIYSIHGRDLSMCKLLVESGADVNYEDATIRSPAEIASLEDERLPILKYLIETKGAKVGESPYLAAKHGALDVVKYFVKEGQFDVNSLEPDPKHGTMLALAAASGHTEVCRYLVDSGADVNKVPDTDWFSPLEQAAIGGHIDTVKFFLGLNKSLKVLHSDVLKRCSSEVRGILEAAGAISESSEKDHLELLIKNDAADELAVVLTKKPALRDAVIRDGGMTALMLCVLYDSVNCAGRLKRLGADMSCVPDGYLPPLQYAAKIGSEKVFKYFIEECSLPMGNCAILAVENGRTKILDYLLRTRINGISVLDINKSNYGSLTLLSCAAFNGNNEMCRWLIEKGARLDVKDNKGWTPLWRAVQQNKVETVRFLVENYHMSRDAIEAAAIVAAENGSLSSLKYFLDQCNVSPMLARKAGNEKCGCLLANAAGYGNLNIVKYLVEEKAVPVDYTPVGKEGLFFDDEFYSALHMALMNGKADVVEYLRSKGAKKE